MKTPIKKETEVTTQSNYKSQHNFVIQGFENTGVGWQDSRYGGHTRALAEKCMERIGHEISMPGTRLRVVRSIGKV